MGTIITYVAMIIYGLIKTLPITFMFLLSLWNKNRKHKKSISVANNLFIIGFFFGFLFVLVLTVNGLVSGYDKNDVDYSINLLPFTSNHMLYKKMFQGNIGSIINIVGNIILFSPFGFFLTYFLKGINKRLKNCFFIGVVMSVMIEVVQLVFGRAFDIDDIILNVMGIMFGYYIFTYINTVFGKFDYTSFPNELQFKEATMSGKFIDCILFIGIIVMVVL